MSTNVAIITVEEEMVKHWGEGGREGKAMARNTIVLQVSSTCSIRGVWEHTPHPTQINEALRSILRLI